MILILSIAAYLLVALAVFEFLFVRATPRYDPKDRPGDIAASMFWPVFLVLAGLITLVVLVWWLAGRWSGR